MTATAKQVEKPNCYTCKWRGTIPGDAHSCCLHPLTGCTGNLFEDTVTLVSGKALLAATSLGILAEEHGVRSGWFYWPANFDPVWLEACSGWEVRISETALSGPAANQEAAP